MNILFQNLLKISRKIYSIIYPDASNFGRNWKMFPNKQYSNELIYQMLTDEKACMIARFGSAELQLITNYLGIKYSGKYKSIKKYIQGRTPAWWWVSSNIMQIKTNAGFFSNDINRIKQFCELMLQDIHQVDILGSWLKEEGFLCDELKNAKKLVLEDLEPFFAPNPWTKALEGKKVLVIHPFIDSIEQQYLKRKLLFENNLLPEFELKTIKAVQSIAGEKIDFKDWFEALESMKTKIEKIDFDICIIGAGAYGFPLAAHVKRLGKKALHMAGVTQLLFGIKGKRWETFIVYPYTNLFNENWVRPFDHERPNNANDVEGACYW